MALNAKKVFSILNKNMKSLASGVKKVSQKDLHTIEFETNDGNKFDITISAGVIDVQFDNSTSILKITYADGTTSDIDLTSTISDTKEIEITTASTTWQLQHNLGTKTPSLLLLDDNNTSIGGEVDYAGATDNLITVSFCEPKKGKAIISK